MSENDGYVGICQKMSETVGKCRKMAKDVRFVGKCQKLSENVGKCRKLLELVGKCPENVGVTCGGDLFDQFGLIINSPQKM